jgi:hypothetical protein
MLKQNTVQLVYLEWDAVLGRDLVTSNNLLIGLAHEVLVLPEKIPYISG